MKYYIILSWSILFFLGWTFMSYFLWEIESHKTWKLFLILGLTFCGYLVIKNIQVYSKIRRNKNILQVSKFLSSKTYDLDEITSWKEESNYYRVSFRKIRINFQNNSLTLIDHADRVNISDLYHYLRTHYNGRMIEP